MRPNFFFFLMLYGLLWFHFGEGSSILASHIKEVPNLSQLDLQKSEQI